MWSELQSKSLKKIGSSLNQFQLVRLVLAAMEILIFNPIDQP